MESALNPKWSRAEKEYLSQHIPNGVTFYYDHVRDTYCIACAVRTESGAAVKKIIRTVKRKVVLQWSYPQRVMSYVARRAMMNADIPVEMRARE